MRINKVNAMAAVAACVVGLCGSVQSLDAQDNAGEVHVGLRTGVMVGNGEPSNDIISQGIYGRYNLGDGWLVGLSLDMAEFDVEYPYQQLGYTITNTEAIDAKADATYVAAWVEREYMRDNSSMVLFWQAGLGIGMIDAPNIMVNIDDGRDATIATDTGTEIIPGIGCGVRFLLGDHWFIEPSLHVDYHITDITVRDVDTGLSSSFDDYLTFGVQIGAGMRF